MLPTILHVSAFQEMCRYFQHTDIHAYRLTNKQADGQADRQADGQKG